MCGSANRSISNLLGLHVISGDASVTERLAAYSSAIVARSDGISGASARAAALLVQAVRNQANVLSYRDGFLIVSFAVIVTLLLTALLRPAPSPAAAITRPPPRVSSDPPAAARRSG